MNLTRIIESDFLPYFVIGVIATLIDWSTFWVLIDFGKFHYEYALVGAYAFAGITHYIANKMITFKCHSKQIGSQFSLYIAVTLTGLGLSMAAMGLFVSIFRLDKFIARIITSILMLVPNYLLHKNITYSKKIFIQQPEAN